MALREGFVAAKKSVSRSSSWQSCGSIDEGREDDDRVVAQNPIGTPRLMTTKQRSTLSISSASSSEGVKKKRLFAPFRSHDPTSSGREGDAAAAETKDDVAAEIEKQPRFRRGRGLNRRRNCVIQ